MKNNFNLTKFLTENKLTRASRLREQEEHENSYERDYQAASQLVKGADLLFSFNRPARDLDEVEELVFQHNKSGKFYYWYDEQGEETGIVEITPLEALHAVKFGLDQRSDLPERLPHDYEFEIYYKGAAGSVFSETVKRKKLTSNSRQFTEAAPELTVGSQVEYDGDRWLVINIDGNEVNLVEIGEDGYTVQPGDINQENPQVGDVVDGPGIDSIEALVVNVDENEIDVIELKQNGITVDRSELST